MQLPAISATALVHPSVMRCGYGHGSVPIHTHIHTDTYTHIHTPSQHLGNSICRSFRTIAVPAAVAGKQHFSAFFTYLQIFSFLVFGLLISGPGLERERKRAEVWSKCRRQRCRRNGCVGIMAFFFAALSTQLKALKCNATKAICKSNQFSI